MSLHIWYSFVAWQMLQNVCFIPHCKKPCQIPVWTLGRRTDSHGLWFCATVIYIYNYIISQCSKTSWKKKQRQYGKKYFKQREYQEIKVRNLILCTKWGRTVAWALQAGGGSSSPEKRWRYSRFLKSSNMALLMLLGRDRYKLNV
jgi:hypothetical protein